ncbi:MAG: restriction endonuclease subunit S [Campylobacteraceae bacterium]|nr:restriction endonuclease subunit S [Campylobacteraceae bacterium]
MKDVEWGEFRLGDLFEIKNTLSFNKDSLVFGSEYDYVTRTSQNEGILQQTGFVNQENLNSANIWSLGLLQMDFFYREKPWYAGQFVRKIIPKFDCNRKLAHFFTVILNNQKRILLSYLVRDVDKIFKKIIVKLPTKNKKIDFDFMESFISELESQKIKNLENYLEANGLKEYELTEEEKRVLEDFENGNFEWSEFKIGDLFEINSYKKRFDANKVTILDAGKPYVARTSLNNGVRGYINEDEQHLNDGNTISFGQDTATVFYQEKPYFTGDKIKIIKSKDDKFNKQNAQFFIATMTRSFSSFSWGGSSFNVQIIGNQPIQIPTKNNQPDYKLMEILIRAVQKMVIKDVVKYVENKGDKA